MQFENSLEKKMFLLKNIFPSWPALILFSAVAPAGRETAAVGGTGRGRGGGRGWVRGADRRRHRGWRHRTGAHRQWQGQVVAQTLALLTAPRAQQGDYRTQTYLRGKNGWHGRETEVADSWRGGNIYLSAFCNPKHRLLRIPCLHWRVTTLFYSFRLWWRVLWKDLSLKVRKMTDHRWKVSQSLKCFLTFVWRYCGQFKTDKKREACFSLKSQPKVMITTRRHYFQWFVFVFGFRLFSLSGS